MELEKSNHIVTKEKDLKDMSQSEFIALIMKLNKKSKPKIVVVDDYKPFPKQRTVKPERPIPTPRKSVKQMVQEYEYNIIPPPPQFRDDYKPVPLPRTKKQY